MSQSVVIDASLAVQWAIAEEYSRQALALAQRWMEAGVLLLAPGLILAEINNAIYKRVVRKEMALQDAQEALDIILDFDFEIIEQPGLQKLAMQLGHRLGRPTTYDCQYLALAELQDCDFWTADRRFYNSAHREYTRVKWIGAPPA